MTQLNWALNILERWSRLTAVGLAAVATVAAQAPRTEFPPTTLARGVQQVRDRSFALASNTLHGLPAKLPQLADYAAFYLGQVQHEQRNFQSALADLAVVYRHQPVSPYASRAIAMSASTLNETGRPKEAIAIVKQYYKVMPQWSAEAALAGSYEAAGDLVSAAVSWQQVYYKYPASEAGGEAGEALGRLKLRLGDRYPPVLSQDLLGRAKALAAVRRYSEAKREYENALPVLTATERDLARVRIGAMDYQSRQYVASYQYLRSLDVADGEPDAERLFHLTYVAKRLDREVDMRQHLRDLGSKYPNSPWRQEALVTAAYVYLSKNEESEYEPMYKACSGNTTGPQSSFCDWKLTWAGYLRQPGGASTLFQTHLRKYPTSEKAPASLYFLARQAEHQRDYGTARVYYESLDHNVPNHYYAMLARERLETAAISRALPSAEAQAFLRQVGFPNRRISVSFEPTRATSLIWRNRSCDSRPGRMANRRLSPWNLPSSWISAARTTRRCGR
jgi:TolA-binding protein